MACAGSLIESPWSVAFDNEAEGEPMDEIVKTRDLIGELLVRWGDSAVALDTALRLLHAQDRTGDALILISQAMQDAFQYGPICPW
ncbi:hypothetical protein NDN01_24060 [Sphingomonas sp. QA11]|uniref:hypothetical protein n=1 Tax=Sphingomonas sp. QA11 TaxID=2950605 RepID=UPI00234B2A52|nr:hypothetical protein [Sphingomonas sp. QA11]WCM27021.1 hypothetical protein NDN01_24060 [Sphingomonas sp. QA11]